MEGMDLTTLPGVDASITIAAHARGRHLSDFTLGVQARAEHAGLSEATAESHELIKAANILAAATPEPPPTSLDNRYRQSTPR